MHSSDYGDRAKVIQFVSAKASPGDLDILLIMVEDFEVDVILERAKAVFDSVRGKLLCHADVLRGRVSIGDELLAVWLDTHQISRSFRKRGTVEPEPP